MKLVKWLDKHLEEILLVALLFVMMIIINANLKVSWKFRENSTLVPDGRHVVPP